MKLTPFGESVRVLRMKFGLSLKSMAASMEISSAYLSSIEFGEKRLAQKHIDTAIAYLKAFATSDQLHDLRQAAEESKDILDMGGLAPNARGQVAAFARKLQNGGKPPDEILGWLNSRN